MNLEELKNRIFPNVEPWHHAARLTMLPLTTINNIEYCIKECVKNGIEGDYIECGVWRGGAVIFANEVFKSLGEKRKNICGRIRLKGCPYRTPKPILQMRGILIILWMT